MNRFVNLRMVRIGPPTAHGGNIAATREPSSRRASSSGCISEISSPQARAMFLMATVRFRGSRSPVRHASSRRPSRSTKTRRPPSFTITSVIPWIDEEILNRSKERQDAIEAAHSDTPREMVEVAGLDIEIVRLQVAVLRWQRIQAVIRQRDRLRVLQLHEDARLKDVVGLEGVRLARTERVLIGRRLAAQQRDVRADARLGDGVLRLQLVRSAAQFRRDLRCQFVAGREEQLRPEALQQRPPGIVASQCGSQGADALRRDDGNEPGLT